MIDPTLLVAVPDPSSLVSNHKLAPQFAWVDRANGVCVQAWTNRTPGCNGTPWEGTLSVCVKHSRADNPVDYLKREYTMPLVWDDLQAIKDHLWPNRIAVEVYPPKAAIVDDAALRWLWVLPSGAMLPFNLTGDKFLVS